MSFDNRVTRIFAKLAFLPGDLSVRAFSMAFGKAVPYVSTSGVRIESVTEQKVVASVKNRRKVRNHVGGVHAAAVALLAETTSGLIVGRNIPDSALPLIKCMKLDYVSRNYGDFRAEATLTEAQIEAQTISQVTDSLPRPSVRVTGTTVVPFGSVRRDSICASVSVASARKSP